MCERFDPGQRMHGDERGKTLLAMLGEGHGSAQQADIETVHQEIKIYRATNTNKPMEVSDLGNIPRLRGTALVARGTGITDGAALCGSLLPGGNPGLHSAHRVWTARGARL
jgi:DNA-binding phage protein